LVPPNGTGPPYNSPKKGIPLKGQHSPAGEVITPTSKLIRETRAPKSIGYEINLDAVSRLRDKIKAGVKGSQIESELREEIERLKLELGDLRTRSASEREVQQTLQAELRSREEELTSLKRDRSILEWKAAQSENAERDKVSLQSSYDRLAEAYRDLAKERDILQSRLDVSASSLAKEIDGEVQESRLRLAKDRIDELSNSLRQAEADKIQAELGAEELRNRLQHEIAKNVDGVAEMTVELEETQEERKGLSQQVGRLQETINRIETDLEISNQAVNAMSTLLKLIAGDSAVSELFTVQPDQVVLELIQNGAKTLKKPSEQRLSDGSSDEVQDRKPKGRGAGKGASRVNLLGRRGNAVRLSNEGEN